MPHFIVKCDVLSDDIGAVKKSFTLIGLLVVVAIIGILASMLLPSLALVREKAKFVICISQRDQVYKIMQPGLDDHDDITPMIVDADHLNPVNPSWEVDDFPGASRSNPGELHNGVMGLYANGSIKGVNTKDSLEAWPRPY